MMLTWLNCLIVLSSCIISFFQNKSAFLCGVMKTYRQREKQGTKVSDTNKGPDEAKIKVRTHSKKKFSVPSYMCYPTSLLWNLEEFIWFMAVKQCPSLLSMFSDHQALLERTGYTLDVTTGQRKYGGPPPESAHSGAQPTIGTEVQNFITCHLLSCTIH